MSTDFGLLVAGLLPVFATIALGFVLGQKRLLTETQWTGLNKATYWIFLPSIIVVTLATNDLTGLPVLALVAVLVLAVVIMSGLLLAAMTPALRRSRHSAPALSSLFQVGTRWNVFVVVAIVAELIGQSGIALVAVGMVATMPLINIINVSVLTAMLSDGQVRPVELARRVAANPIVVGCLVGLAIGGTGVSPWGPVVSVLDILGSAALGVSLLCVGAGLQPADAIRPPRLALVGCAVRLVMMPLLVAGLAIALGLSGDALIVALLIAGVPTAANGYILASQMGGDAPLYASSMTLQVAASLVTIPILLLIAGGLAR